MSFVIIRIVFWSIAFFIGSLLIIKSHLVYKRMCLICWLVVTVVLVTISALLPIENALITFSSPESAYSYSNPGNVMLIVDGADSDFAIGENGDEYIYIIIPKVNGRWKIGMGFNTKKIIQMVSDGVTIDVYQYKNTGDYFITVLDTNSGPCEISDSCNSKFDYLKKYNSTLEKSFYTYYAYINGFNDQYVLNVNGNAIKIGTKLVT